MHGDGGESDNFANFEEDMIATRGSYALFIEGNTCMATAVIEILLSAMWRRCSSAVRRNRTWLIKRSLTDLLAIPAIYMVCILLSIFLLASRTFWERRQC